MDGTTQIDGALCERETVCRLHQPTSPAARMQLGGVVCHSWHTVSPVRNLPQDQKLHIEHQ